jgi:hypothetical protein
LFFFSIFGAYKLMQTQTTFDSVFKEHTNQVTSGIGDPVTEHSNTAFCPSSTVTSWSSVTNFAGANSLQNKKGHFLKK